MSATLQDCDRCGAPESAPERGNGTANWCEACWTERAPEPLSDEWIERWKAKTSATFAELRAIDAEESRVIREGAAEVRAALRGVLS